MLTIRFQATLHRERTSGMLREADVPLNDWNWVVSGQAGIGWETVLADIQLLTWLTSALANIAAID
jgi:hypothetical protein